MARKRDLSNPLAASEFDDNKPEIRRDTTGQGKKRSVKVTGRGEDKVKTVYKKKKDGTGYRVARRKKGTVVTNLQKARKKFHENRLKSLEAKDKAIEKKKTIQRRKRNEADPSYSEFKKSKQTKK